MSRLDRSPEEIRSAGGIAPLAVLPVFLPLTGKPAVVIGGNAGAAWKARLLAAAGASVTVLASEIGEEMREAATAASPGSIELIERDWTPVDLARARTVIVAVEDEAEAEQAVAAARAAGATVNAVDRPALCDFQFGAIVNRSPLVVGISTDGAAPVLAQTLRSKIEALMPLGLAGWLEAAKAWRERVMARLATASARRAFWQRFADRAFAEADRAPEARDLGELLAGEKGESGSIALVGAGPGDPELLTLKAVRALRAADVVLYDDLVAPEILDFTRREARVMLVGKTGHKPSCRQEDINALMVGLARKGKRVVRLKSGDPAIFGRAGEEIAAARAAGIAIELVPGISAAQGAAARLGISLTLRGASRRVQFVTGHDRHGKAPDDLAGHAIADPRATTAVYMPKATLGELLGRAMAAGLPGGTPAVAIVNATRVDEHVVAATAATLGEKVAALPDGPCLVLVGEAIREAASVRRSEPSARAG